MILATATNHFNEDIIRAKEILTHANTLQAGRLKEDLLRASWMMAVGALDAFFCDAYGDLIARTVRAKITEPAIQIPDRIKNLKVPADMVLGNNINDAWLWRMVARDLIEKDNVLSILKIKDLFNHFFRAGGKLFHENGASIDRWILHRDSKFRLFGITKTNYRATAAQNKNSVKKKAIDQLEERFKEIFQRRHDCIHNCDRPKTAIQIRNVTPVYITKVIDDIDFLVKRCTDEFRTEFRVYLTGLGFSAITRNQVGA
jgi:hypothetical protein